MKKRILICFFNDILISSTGIPVDWGIYSTTHSPTVMVSRAIQFIVNS